MTWITLPSVSVQNGSKIVTVNNTQTTNIKVGDALLIGNYQPVEIAGVFATQLSLRTNWSNAAQANASAVVLPTFGDFNAATQALRQATQVTQGNFKTLEDWGTKLGNITFEGQDNSKHSARTLLQMDADVSELEEQANNLIVSLSGLNFALSKAIVDVIRGVNNEQYAASGFIHYGKHYTPSIAASVNEGMTCAANSPNVVAIGRATSEIAGSSKTNHAVVNMAGFTSNLITSATHSMFSIKYPEAPKGTVVYDSSGNCRGTGKPTLDLSEEIDPKYGDVAGSVNEAVARAFEGQVKNGDLRLGLSHWASYQENSMSITNGVLSGASGSNSNTCLHQVGTTYTAGKQYKVILKNVSSNQSFTVRLAGRYIANEAKPACSNIDMEFLVTTDQTGTGLSIAGSGIGAVISFSSISVTPVTEEVVTERPDLFGIEGYLEKANGTLYPYGCIQGLLTTADGVATEVDNSRPITYFAAYTGDTTSRGRRWDLSKLTFVQLATIMSNPAHNAYYTKEGELVQFRVRQRTIAGAGNGDWLNTNSNGTATLAYAAESRQCNPQGALDIPSTVGWYQGSLNTSNPIPETGVFTASNNTSGMLNNECYFMVMGTVPRLNQGAYHPRFNPMGTTLWRDSTGNHGGGSWNSNFVGKPTTVVDCFFYYPADTTPYTKPGALAYHGNIGRGTSRPDGKFYDAIYASGQGGVIDFRMSAWDMGSKEEASKIFQKVVNGTYRGLEKLTWTWLTPVVVQTASTQATSIAVEVNTQHLYKLGDRVSLYDVTTNSTLVTTKITGIRNGAVDVAATFNRLVGAAHLVVTTETNNSVSGNFSQVDVIGSPVEILKIDALKNGWMGGWIPVIPKGSSQAYKLVRKMVTSGNTFAAPYTTNNGTSWSSQPLTINGTTNAVTANWDAKHVWLVPYTAFAKQTKPSTNKPVLNGSEGLGDVLATARSHKDDGVLFAESLIGKVPTSTAAPYSQILSFYGSRFGSDGKIAQHLTAGEHNPLTMAAPTNDSPAVKALWHQASDNQQTTLNFLWNELIFDTNWRTPDKVWSGGSVAVAAGETFRAESSSAYAVAGLLMRCVKAVTANATVLGAMHVSEGGDVISLSDGQTYFKVVNNGWSDDSTIRIIDGVGTFNNENGDTCLYGISELAMPYGYTKNQAGAGKQVVGVDL
ncbi:hypothetical protein [Vibrio vulnificus]|uniref:hypothetical protein n=1 Tax=Vibrio vulnificus TaxID=672 RepID=UPI003133A4E5